MVDELGFAVVFVEDEGLLDVDGFVDVIIVVDEGERLSRGEHVAPRSPTPLKLSLAPLPRDKSNLVFWV